MGCLSNSLIIYNKIIKWMKEVVADLTSNIALTEGALDDYIQSYACYYDTMTKK